MNGATHLITVNAGGHMQASNSTFPSSLNQVTLNSGCIFNAGDLTGNSFNCPLYLPLNDVPYLSGTGNNNAQFQNIYMLAGSVASGQTLALGAIGTVSNLNLKYFFAEAMTVSPGGALTVAASQPVQIQAAVTVSATGLLTFGNYDTVAIQSGVTITDNGSLSFGTGDALSMYGSYGSTQQIVVGNGGLLTSPVRPSPPPT